MQIDLEKATKDEREIVKDYRRRKGLLRKHPLKMMNQFDDIEIYSQEALSLNV